MFACPGQENTDDRCSVGDAENILFADADGKHPSDCSLSRTRTYKHKQITLALTTASSSIADHTLHALLFYVYLIPSWSRCGGYITDFILGVIFIWILVVK